MMRSMFSGVSGMRNFQYELDVIGNNISNVNTVGFKGSRVTFQTALLQTLKAARAPQDNMGGTNPIQIGLGSQLATVDKIMTQGSFQNTGRKLDLAIQGDGFFVLSDGQRYYYTRAGALDVDMNGTLIQASTGLKVQGWTAVQDPDTGRRYIDTNQPIGDIILAAGLTMPARPTTAATLEGNLRSDVGPMPFSITVTDDEGNEHTVQFVFSKDFTGQDDPFSKLQRYNWEAIDEAGNVIATGYVVVNEFGRVQESGVTQRRFSHTATATGSQLTQADFPYLKLSEGIYNVIVVNQTGQVVFSGPIDVDQNGTFSSINVGSPGTYTVTFVGPSFSYQATAGTDGVLNQDDFGDLTLSPGTYNVTVEDQTQQIIFSGPITVDKDGNFTISATGIQSGQTYTVTFQGAGNEITIADGASISIPTAGELRFYESDNPSNFVVASYDNPRYVTSVQVYDTLGNPYTLYIEFMRIGKFGDMQNAWLWRAYTDSGEQITYIDAEDNSGYDGGIIDFSDTGRLNAMYGIRWVNGDLEVGDVELRTIQFSAEHMGDSTVTIDLDMSAITQFAGVSSVSFTWQNGNALGTLQSFAVNEAGEIIGTFSNGLTDILGQVAMAIFNNPAGLTEVGNSLYVESANSGLAQIGTPGSGGRGTIMPGALEMSNVDLAEEFTRMIIAQRGFQANARVITTADTILGELVALRR